MQTKSSTTILPFQFTICSSVFSDALLSPLMFFQLLRPSGTPWIHVELDPRPHEESTRNGGHMFKFSVRLRLIPNFYSDPLS